MSKTEKSLVKHLLMSHSHAIHALEGPEADEITSWLQLHPLHALAHFVRDPLVLESKLLDWKGAGLLLDTYDLSGRTPLHVAASALNSEAFFAFIQHGASPFETVQDGFTDVFDLIVDALRFPRAWTGQSLDDPEMGVVLGAINEKAVDDACKCLQMAVSAGASIDPRSALMSAKPNVLIVACGGNDHGLDGDLHQVVRILLRAGADLSYRESDTGRSALHYAAFRGHAQTVRALLDHRADVFAMDHKRMTAMDYADHFHPKNHLLRGMLRGGEMRALVQAASSTSD